MHVINARNAHEALVKGIRYLTQSGVKRDSRNGPVYQSPVPVATVYSHPFEYVVFWPQRDCNPFFHLFESLWMLAGRNDVASVARYAKRMKEFSDDGLTLHGAYGHRWRHWGATIDGMNRGTDQLFFVIEALKKNPDDRRAVIEMWDAARDLGRNGKDVPCNLTITFQVRPSGHLDMVVFNRSNDIIWGAYGANAVHMAVLQEFIAYETGYAVGTYTQISVNYHGYLKTMDPLVDLGGMMDAAGFIPDPYCEQETGVVHVEMRVNKGRHIRTLEWIEEMLRHADDGSLAYLLDKELLGKVAEWTDWQDLVLRMLAAHEVYRRNDAPKRYDLALQVLQGARVTNADWIRAGIEWLTRRQAKWTAESDPA
jgi:hypothetical protein